LIIAAAGFTPDNRTAKVIPLREVYTAYAGMIILPPCMKHMKILMAP
jgi:hypothetical protein